MKTSEQGIELIKRFEGCRLTTYECAAGVLTIGYGHTGTDVKEGMTITDEKATALLKKDIEKFETGVNESVEVEITQNMFDALVSFSFNVGTGAFKKSTLLKKLNSKDYKGAANEFLKWNKVTKNGKKEVVAGLTNRRNSEKELFETGIGTLTKNTGIVETTESETTTNNTAAADTTTNTNTAVAEYKVKVTAGALRIRAGAGTNTKVNGVIRDKGVYTIVEEQNGWGKLKSGAGWISLNYTKKI